jgi:putative endonuclease
MGAWLYILRCADNSYYTGTTRADLERRIAEHPFGKYPGFTERRRPIVLVCSEYFEQIAIAAERKVRGWSRAKKEALMARDFSRLEEIAKRRTTFGPHGSRRVAARRSSP